VKIASLFGVSSERTRALNELLAKEEKQYHWWFDHPVDWERPTRTLYVTGWCVSARGRNIFAMRARIGRRKFLGNYGIERKDVGATLAKKPAERIGFAIAVPLPKGKSQVTIEVQEWDGIWRPISTRTVFGTFTGDSQAPIDPKYFIHNPGANPHIEFWLDRPFVWPKKTRQLKISGWCFAISGKELTEVRARVRKNIFPARFGKVRPDIGLRFDDRPGALRSGFSLDAIIPPGRSQFILEARSDKRPWETFFVHPVRGPIFRIKSDSSQTANTSQ
jgi:hypothetical protein